MLVERAGRRWSVVLALLLTLVSFFYDSYRHQFFTSPHFSFSDVLGFLSFPVWRFFLFFYIGAWLRRHFEAFIKWTDKPIVIIAITVVFFYVSSTPHFPKPWFEFFRFYIGGITGMWLIFTCFRRLYSQPSIRNSVPSIFHLPSTVLRFIGTRTLDIYLLHYVFLPRFLMSYSGQLKAYDSQVVEFFFILVVSLCVLSLSLLSSYLIRLSPFLAHYLFGVKRGKAEQ
jgi:hypothetical protein